MRAQFALLVLVTISGVWLLAADDPITGFPGEQTQVQRNLETSFDRELDPADLRSWMQYLSSRPHHVGSAFGREVATFIADRFREWGTTPRSRPTRCCSPLRRSDISR